MNPQARQPLAILIALFISVLRLTLVEIGPSGISPGSAFQYLFVTSASGLSMDPELSISLFFSSTVVFLLVYSLVMLAIALRGAQGDQPSQK